MVVVSAREIPDAQLWRETAMYGVMEKMGSKLLKMFVPEVEAAAAATAGCQRWTYASCWQCGYGPCTAYCCSNGSCSNIICF
ncbi:hypothetical protein [Micromonospora sp. CPCC 205558]|uniref:hypothetical protein n=1 Tax=Micromonospora sp. CPCC 205558 TaxID=3122403 RepID=UPI002FF14044